ncbi:MAG: tubulin-like doman-containing protein, partial [Chloroflexi bacterium]|nr:tubulin-like doman-containing protein [Chloroflexota bacterium]
MTRPALVIGLGGTGQWVLTYLKKDLIESNNGHMPDNVRIMCFDTMPQATAEITAMGISRKGEKEVKVGSIRLEKNKEFIHLGGDILELSRAISDDREKRKNDQQLAHMYWFQDRYWLDNLPLALFRLADGAGQLRQFGRMGLYKDLGDPLKSEVWRRLDAAIGQLDQMRQGQRLEILIVGSFAGGTGSGLFIDLALLARHRARSVPIMLRGYFVLPRAFDADADDDMLARSFAAWRELNRFMVVSQEFALPSMVYNSRDRSLQVQQIRHKLFDLCYLVDGVRGGARVAAEAESGVHPTVADAISAIVDDKAGDAYTKWAENILKEYAVNPGIPLYSTVGTHSYKVPVYYA